MQIQEFKLKMGEKFSLDLIIFAQCQTVHFKIYMSSLCSDTFRRPCPWVLSYSKFREKFQSLKIFSAAQISFFNTSTR